MNVPAGEYEGGGPVGLGGHKPLHLLPGPVVEENLKVGFLEKLLAIVKCQVAYMHIAYCEEHSAKFLSRPSESTNGKSTFIKKRRKSIFGLYFHSNTGPKGK